MAKNNKQGRSIKVTGPLYRQIDEIAKVLNIYSKYEDKVESKYVIDLLTQLHEVLDMAGTICINDAERHEAMSEREGTELPLNGNEAALPNEDNLITYSLSADIFDNIELDQGIDAEEEDED
jgi:hypothetical protein